MRLTKTLKTIVVIILAFGAHLGSYAIAKPHKTKKYTMRLPEVCKAGKVYTITKVQDLWDNVEDLECIYRVGEEPTSMLLGPMVGVCFTVGNSYLANPLARTIWKGKYTMNGTCAGKTTYLGWNALFGDVGSPYASLIGKVQDFGNIHPAWRDNRSTIVLDYSRDLTTYCPDYDTAIDKFLFTRNGRNTMVTPFDFVVDGMRPVGRQADGGLIYLGQTFVRDGYRSDELMYPVAFFGVISYDENVEKHMKYGHSLTPLKEDVHYYLYNSLDFSNAIFPVDNFFTEPFYGMKMFIYKFLTGFRNSIKYSVQYVAGFYGEDHLRMKTEMEALIARYKAFVDESEANSTSSRIPFLSHNEMVHSHNNEL